MATPATRLITLIMLLQRRPNRKAAELADELGVSIRTLHRYIGMLEEMGIPIYSERGPHGGFSLVRGYKMPPLVLTTEEAVALSLGAGLVEEMWGELYRDAARGAMAKLTNVLPDEQHDEIGWARRSFVVSGMHRMELSAMAPLLERIRRGVREGQRLEIRYESGTASAISERQVDPYTLVHRHGWWYLIAYCHLRRALRTFRVDRIRHLEVAEQSYRIPDDFDVGAYLDNAFAEEPTVRARLRFVPEATRIALSILPGGESIEHLPDGGVELTLVATDIHWLASMVLSFADWVRVLDPPKLQALVRKRAQATVDLYPNRTKEGVESK